MAQTLTEPELIGRDGTSQAARRSEALDPGYVSVDERSIEDLLDAAREHGKKLKYYDDDNRWAGGYWSAFVGDPDLAEVVAFLKDPEKFPEGGPYRRPHFVLFLAFLELFRHAQGKLNQLTRRHLDFYYRQVLRMLPKPAVPDRVSLLFDLAPGVDQVLVPGGSLLSAGPDSLGNERLYATDRDLVVNRARVEKLSSVHVGLRFTGIAEVRERYAEKDWVLKMLEIALGHPLPGDPLPLYPDLGHVQLTLLRDFRKLLLFSRQELCLELFELRELMTLKRQSVLMEATWEGWRRIHYLLEQAGKEKRPLVPGWVLETDDLTDFAGNLDKAVDPDFSKLDQIDDFSQLGIDDIDQYYDEVLCIADFFFVSAEEFLFFMDIADPVKPETPEDRPTPEEWRQVDRILEKAHREKVYTGRRQRIEEFNKPKGTEAGFLAMVAHVLGEEVTTLSGVANRLEPYLTDMSSAFLEGVAAAVEATVPADTADLDWERVYSVLEIAWRNREQLPEPVAEKVERLNLHPAADASAIRVELGLEGELPRWRTFGRVPLAPSPEPPPSLETPAPALGWAVSSPLLALAEGTRTIRLTLGFPPESADGKQLQAFLAEHNPLRFEVSTENGPVEPETVVETVPEGETYKTYEEWIGLSGTDRPNLQGVQFTLTLGEPVAAICALPADPARPASSWPVLRLMLRQLPDEDPEDAPIDFYSQLRQVHLAAVHVAVEVSGLSTVQLQNDETALDPSKPFEPFGTSPAVGSRFLLGHPELAAKRIDRLAFNIEWMGLPKYLADHYKNYGFTGDPGFNARISWIERRVEIAAQAKVALFSTVTVNDEMVTAAKQTLTGPAVGAGPRISADRFGEDLLSWDRYLRWELNAPDFQHQAYPGVASGKAIEMAADIANLKGNATVNADDYQVNPPYTPKIKGLKIDYASSLEIVLDGTRDADADGRIFHVHPFGTSGVEPERSPQGIPLLPRYDDQGELYLGLRDVRAPQTVAVLFQLAEGSADPDLEPAKVRWSYLDGDGWQSLDDGKVLSDATRGLINSGIVEFDLPAAAPSTLLPGGLYWIRAAVARRTAAVCDTIAIHAQAATATFVDRDNAADHFRQPLPAATLSQLVKPMAEIAGVRQPYTSRGGRMAEAEETFATRVSERLRHKQRALTMWDYERLVLERFPEIYKAKCLPASLNDPGRVVVVVIPDIRHRFPFDPFEPKAPADLLASIAEYLAALAPAVASIEVRNPHYVAVKVRFSVRFQAAGNEGYYKLRLNDELNRFLSPWAYEEGADIAIGDKIYANSLVNFLDRRPYVDYVADLKLFSSDDGENFRPVTAAGEGGYAVTSARADGVLVAARTHEIDLIPEAGYEEELARGINFMKIELDFIVA